MPLFPPETPVTVLLDGKPLAAYVRAYVAAGRVFVPVDPVLTRVADRLWFEGDTLVIQRGARRVRVRLAPSYPSDLDAAYVAAAPALRGLGAVLRYDPAARRLDVRLPQDAQVASPTPFNPALPTAAPSAVFTPAPQASPRPAWTGSPLPRRTPLPLSTPP